MNETDYECASFELRRLVESSLPYIDESKFNSVNNCRWAFICFVVGAAAYKLGSSTAELQTICTQTIVEVFKWPTAGTREHVLDAINSLDEGVDEELFQAGANAMSEFEHSIRWLGATCDAILE